VIGCIPKGMPKKKKSGRSYRTALAFIPAAVLVGFIAYLFLTPTAPNISTIGGSQATTVVSGGLAPSFTLKLINANGLTSQDFTYNPNSGQIVFMEFIHEWCIHCRNMAPIIGRLHQQYADRGVVFITVAGGYNTDAERTAAFLRQFGIDWTAVFDPNLEVFSKYGVRGTPTYFIISPAGYVLTKFEGETTYDRLAQELDKYIVPR